MMAQVMLQPSGLLHRIKCQWGSCMVVNWRPPFTNVGIEWAVAYGDVLPPLTATAFRWVLAPI